MLSICYDRNTTMNIKKGLGPHSKPWPIGSEFDTDLLSDGDYRNVEDRFRYRTIESIKNELKKSSNNIEVAIENYKHDFNIGTIVRNCNAFNVRKVHIIGSKQWNKRGAMVTDRYLDIEYHKNTSEFLKNNSQKRIIAIDKISGSKPLAKAKLPTGAIYVFGSESDGVSKEIQKACEDIIHIEQFGSTRSVNVGVASGIFLYEWIRQSGIL